MKKLLSLSLISLLGLILIGCKNINADDNNSITEEESEYVITDDLVSLELIDILSNTRATFVLINHTDDYYIYGERFLIEYEKDGTWYSIPPKNPLIFISIGYILEPKKYINRTYDWTPYYDLEASKYRLVTSVLPEMNHTDLIYIAAEFIIN